MLFNKNVVSCFLGLGFRFPKNNANNTKARNQHLQFSPFFLPTVATGQQLPDEDISQALCITRLEYGVRTSCKMKTTIAQGVPIPGVQSKGRYIKRFCSCTAAWQPETSILFPFRKSYPARSKGDAFSFLERYLNGISTTWYGTVRYGMVRYGTVRHGTARHGTARRYKNKRHLYLFSNGISTVSRL